MLKTKVMTNKSIWPT